MHIDLAIVENNLDDVALIRAMLAANATASFDIRHVQRPSDLATLCSSTRPPDVLLLDLNLPDARGSATINQIRHDLPHVPVVAITSSVQDKTVLDAAAAGVQDFIIRGEFDGHSLAQTLNFAIARQRSNSTLFDQANIDAMTGLPNRFLFQDRLNHALQRANRTDETVALLFIDIDNFKNINEVYGRDSGDHYLCAIANTFVTTVRDSDTVARLKGDRFAVIVEGLNYPQAAIDVAKKILAAAARPVELVEHTLQGSCSIGIAFHTEDKTKGQQWLIKGADTALKSAKSSGKNTYCTYTKALDRALVKRINQDSMLQCALSNDEFHLFYQPIVDTQTKRLVAYETLVRWQPPGKRPILPGTFISSLERLGLMRDVGEFILRKAIRQHVIWTDQHESSISVCVNISASQIADPNFARLVRSALDTYGLAPQYLSLELTEDQLINNTPDTRRVFDELSEFGVKFSIDDFGTGHNSYNYLKNFPISTIKIDRSFTRLLHVNRFDRAIARSLIALARELDLNTVAEGVENHIVLAELESLGPDALQGFLIGRPMPVERFEHRFMQPEAAAVATSPWPPELATASRVRG